MGAFDHQHMGFSLKASGMACTHANGDDDRAGTHYLQIKIIKKPLIR
jgi:hypothetical protein